MRQDWKTDLNTPDQETGLIDQTSGAALVTGDTQVDHSTGLLAPKGIEWVVPNDLSRCSHSDSGSFFTEEVPCLDLTDASNNPLSTQGVICAEDSEESSSWYRTALRERAYRVRLERREEALLNELGISWECLHAVYEIGRASGCEQTSAELFEVIVEQIRNLHPELKVVVWLLDDECFRPATTAGVSAQEFLPLARNSLAGLGIDGRSRIGKFPGEEANLSRGLMLEQATLYALIPLTNTGRNFGFLQVWREGELPEFNSPLTRFLEAMAAHAVLSLENIRMRQEWLATDRLKHELSIGSEIQQRLLLSSPPKELSGLQLALASLPSRQIGGDFVDFVRNGDKSLDLIVGDVMGKGVPAALLAAAVKEEFQRARVRLVSSSNPVLRPDTITNEAHQSLGCQLVDLETFASACFARIDVESHTLTLVDCGHPKTLHWRSQRNECETIAGVNVPLGIKLGEVYQLVSVSFQPDDVFIFYSDGVTDARNSSGELFGERRLKALLRKSHRLHPSRIIQQIRSELTEFVDSQCLEDDWTCVVVKIADPISQCPFLRIEEELSSDINELGEIRAIVRRICVPTPEIPDLTRHHLEIGLTEVLSNVIRHSYHQSPDYPITVHAENSGSQLLFRIYHWGESFIPEEEPRLDLSMDSGFGRYLIARIFDQTTYTTDEYGRTCIRLEKNLKGDNYE
jgi:sigma-B regulation protein RsbU (phosphoserine phosphatase)